MFGLRGASIRSRIVGISMATSTFALVVASAAFVGYETRAFRRSLVEEVASMAVVVGQNSTAALAFDDRRTAEENLRALASSSHVEVATLLTKDGRVVARYLRAPGAVVLTPAAAEGEAYTGRHLIVTRNVVLEGEVLGRVVIQTDLSELRGRMMRYGLIVLAIVAASLLVAFVLSSGLQRLISEPIDDLTASIERMSAERGFGVRARVPGGDELGALAGGFNQMLRQLQDRELLLQRARDELEQRVQERTLELQQEIESRKRGEETIRHLAYYDSLTGLPNRLLFYDRLSHALLNAERYQRQVALLFLDLDRFKNINDTLGHAIGDEVLRRVAQRLRECVRTGDTVARLGGDEFPVVIEGIAGSEDAVRVAEKIVGCLQPPFPIEGHELHVTASIGICLFPTDGTDAGSLVKNADLALYRAKDQGRNNYQLYTPGLNARAFERLVLENDLRRSLDRREFVNYYQPIIDPRTGRLLGFEALVRWMHPHLGLVAPRRFIPLAEETGLVLPLSEWVLRDACEQNVAWQRQGLPAVPVSVNVSARHLTQRGFAATVGRILEETGLEKRFLTLELTENALMEHSPATVDRIQELGDLGVAVSIDDFGTGYSSLSYLKRLPFSILKIDQSFVADIPRDSDDMAIAGLIIAMAHNLGLEVIAEGVETREQLAFLAEGCDGVQGYLFGRPEPVETTTRLLQEFAQGKGLLPAI